MSTFEKVSYQEFKENAGEFFRASSLDKEGVTFDQVDNGFKALTLLYFGHDDNWTENEVDQAVIVLELAGRRHTEHEIRNLGL